MTLREKFVIVRENFIDKVENWFIKTASIFGFPNNPGLPVIPPKGYYGESFFEGSDLPMRRVPFPPQATPQNLSEVFLGGIPKIQPLDKTYFESQTDGFYNFYIENYSNLFFLPNWLSEFLQINLGFCLDITFLEVFREVLFISIMFFGQIVTLRIILAWIVTINPYTFPWNYFIALVDWTEESLLGLVPTVFGVNLSGPILMTLLGRIADTLNHLVFTMPFLPSEGEPGKTVINEEVKNILVFRYLPILWYKYPIPNEIREFWYTQRPDILKYMQTAYKNLDIQFLPDRIINEISKSLENDLVNNSASSNIISSNSLNKVINFSNHFTHFSEDLFDLFSKFNL
jgi:hypothetical protein